MQVCERSIGLAYLGQKLDHMREEKVKKRPGIGVSSFMIEVLEYTCMVDISTYIQQRKTLRIPLRFSQSYA